jgi:hypothetical protein
MQCMCSLLPQIQQKEVSIATHVELSNVVAALM